MALQVEQETRLGITLPDAYVRIVSIAFSQKNQISVRYQIFANETAANTQGIRPVKGHQIQFEFDDTTETITTPYVLAYNHIKSLPEFSGAIDV